MSWKPTQAEVATLVVTLLGVTLGMGAIFGHLRAGRARALSDGLNRCHGRWGEARGLPHRPNFTHLRAGRARALLDGANSDTQSNRIANETPYSYSDIGDSQQCAKVRRGADIAIRG